MLKVKKADLAMVVIFLAAAFIGYRFIYAGSERKIKALRQKLEETRQRNVILAQVGVLSATMERLEKGITGYRDEAWLISDVHNIAGRTNVKVLSAEPQPRETAGEYSKISVHIEAQCSYHEFGEFISEVENGPDYLKVEECKIQSGAEAGGIGTELPPERLEGVPKVTMTIVSYFKAE